jgi:pseudaminic acid synthase
MNISFGNINISKDNPPFVIAEVSANHNGDIERAKKTILAAKNSGASAVKIQTYTADTMTIDSDMPDFIINDGLWSGYKLYDLYKWAETPYEWHSELFSFAKTNNIPLFSTPFDETAVDLLESLDTPGYKIASFEILDLQLIEKVANTGKPIILSTGMSSLEEIEDAVDMIKKCGNTQYIILHCISSYPAPIHEVNLKQMDYLSKRFNTIVGLSDHTLTNTCAISSIAMGGRVIEKHFTLSRGDKGPDSEFSIEPDELKKLCIECKNTYEAMGNANFQVKESEKSNIKFRRSLYFVKSLKKGELITDEHVRRIRPGYGLQPKYYNHIIGKKVKIDVKKGSPVNFNNVDIEND